MLRLIHEEDIVGQDYPTEDRPYTGPARGARRWCGTWNNYPVNGVDLLKALKYPKVEWGIFAREMAPTTGTPHLQIYIAFKNNVRYDTLRGLFPGSWWKIARGNHHDNFLYINKTRPEKTYKDGTIRAADPVPNDPEDVFEIGTRPNFAAMLEGMYDLVIDLYETLCDVHYKYDDQMSDREEQRDGACEDCAVCTHCIHAMHERYVTARALLELRNYEI